MTAVSKYFCAWAKTLWSTKVSFSFFVSIKVSNSISSINVKKSWSRRNCLNRNTASVRRQKSCLGMLNTGTTAVCFAGTLDNVFEERKLKIRFLSIVRSTCMITVKFVDLLESMCLTEHVRSPTCNSDNYQRRPISDWYTTNHCSVLYSLCAFRPLHASKIFEILDKHCLEIHCLCRQVIVNSTVLLS